MQLLPCSAYLSSIVDSRPISLLISEKAIPRSIVLIISVHLYMANITIQFKLASLIVANWHMRLMCQIALAAEVSSFVIFKCTDRGQTVTQNQAQMSW